MASTRSFSSTLEMGKIYVFSFHWAAHGARRNKYELNALFTLVRWRARFSGFLGQRFAVFVCSLVMSCLVAMDWSSSRRLNFLLRRLSACFLVSSFFLCFANVTSSSNPADRLSRTFPPTSAQLQRQSALEVRVVECLRMMVNKRERGTRQEQWDGQWRQSLIERG